MKTVLITGATGFIGKNLSVTLEGIKDIEVLTYNRNNTLDELKEYVQRSDFVFHLAGINRPKDISEFEIGNKGFTEELLTLLKRNNRKTSVLFSSSTQAELENPYGLSKKSAENAVIEYGRTTGANTYIYRLPNVYGKWCKPNYNSVIATFCQNATHNLPVTVNDSSVVLNLAYIDDVVEELISALNGSENSVGDFCEIPIVDTITLGEIVDLIYKFKKSREERTVPDMSNGFTKKLYSTYLSYLPESQFSYELKMNVDQRGSFTEFIKTPDRGQVSVNISKAGIRKGNHWHHTKNEKFLVVSGKGVIRLRNINSNEVIEYFVSGEKLEVVDIPTGYTHNIENLCSVDMVTIMWANEHFDPVKPDTYYLEV